jgi:hypothetical protein
MTKIAYLCCYVIVLLSVAGCAHCPAKDDEKMLSLAVSLTKLSTKVESVVRYGNPPENASTNDLLKLAVQRESTLLDDFSGYEIRIISSEKHAILLLCSGDGKRGLLEDLGCTAMLDRNLWREESDMPCRVSLSVELGCGQVK